MGRRAIVVRLPKFKIKKQGQGENQKTNDNLVIFAAGSLGGVVLVLIDVFVWDIPNFADWLNRLIK